jgi:hypothetical protein
LSYFCKEIEVVLGLKKLIVAKDPHGLS